MKEELNSEEELDRELDEAVKRIEKEKKRAAKKERESKNKSDLRHKMSVIATTTGIDNDEELNMSSRLWDEVRKQGFEAFNADNSDDEESSSESSEDELASDESGDESEDDKLAHINSMADEMEENIKKTKAFQMTVDRKIQKREIKNKLLIDQQRLRASDESEEDQLANKVLRQPIARIDGLDNESSGDSGSEEETSKAFVNPLAKKKTIDVAGEVSEGEWSEDGDEKKDSKKKAKKEKKPKLGKRKRGELSDEEENKMQDFFGGEIEEVPQNDPGLKGYESMDSDDIAETRVIAKKMLRKKERSEILDATYNRYSFGEDPYSLPTWFVEDEQKHYFRHYNATKEEIAIEKEELKVYNARPSKKVEQAKNRKKKRLAKAMQKIKGKAQIIADQDMNEMSKMKQI